MVDLAEPGSGVDWAKLLMDDETDDLIISVSRDKIA